MTSTTLSPIDVEAAIVARLAATVKEAGTVKYVYDTREYGAVVEESQLTPALAVIYNGYRAGTELTRGAVQQVEILFLVVAITRSAVGTLRATGAKSEASDVFNAAMQALTGWKPGKGIKALQLEDAPGAGYSDAGFTYLPIAYSTSITYTPTFPATP